jgi:hypothetical protein
MAQGGRSKIDWHGKTVLQRRAVLGVVATAGLVFAWWEGSYSWPSIEAHIGIAAAIVAVFALAGCSGKHRQRMQSGPWIRRIWDGLTGLVQRPTPLAWGALVWMALALAIASWDIRSFLLQVHYLPTLSHLIGRVTRFVIGRSLLVALWLALGVYFAVGHRVNRDEPRPLLSPGGADEVQGGGAS